MPARCLRSVDKGEMIMGKAVVEGTKTVQLLHDGAPVPCGSKLPRGKPFTLALDAPDPDTQYLLEVYNGEPAAGGPGSFMAADTLECSHRVRVAVEGPTTGVQYTPELAMTAFSVRAAYSTDYSVAVAVTPECRFELLDHQMGGGAGGSGGGSNGEQMCEGHGYDEATCKSIGCCQYDNGNCWSDVGTGPCTGSGSGSGGTGGAYYKPDPGCPPGKFNASTGECVDCAADSYSSGYDADMCTPCPAGTRLAECVL